MYVPLCGEELDDQACMDPPRAIPIPQTAQARPEGLRCFHRCVGRGWKVNHTRGPPRSAPTARARPERLGCMCRCVGGSWKSKRAWPPLEASVSPKWPRHDWRDSGAFAALWGGAGRSITSDPPTGRPLPPNGPRRTGATRVLPPLCGEGLEGQSYPSPPRGAPIPHTAQARLEGLGCMCRCGEELDVQTRVAAHKVYLSPKQPKRDRGDSGASAAMRGGAGRSIIPEPPSGRPYPPYGPEDWGASGVCGAVGRSWMSKRAWPPTRYPYPPNGASRTGGTRVLPPLCTEGLEGQSNPIAPWGAPSPKRPGQDNMDSDVTAAMWGGSGRSIIPDHPSRRPYTRNGPRSTRGTRVYPPLCGEELDVQMRMVPRQGVRIPQMDQVAVCAAVWGGARRSIIPDPPTRRPYPRDGPGTTGETWVYVQLCGEESEVQMCMVPRRSVPIHQTAQGGPKGLGCICRCVGRGWKVNHTRPPHTASLSPKRPSPDQRDSGVSAAMWGGVRSPLAHGPRTGRPHSPIQLDRTGGTGVQLPLCGGGWKVNRT